MSSSRKFRRHAETSAEVQYRLSSEANCRQIAELIKTKLAPGLGFVLVTADYGEAGADFSNASYVASIERDDSARLLTELLDVWADEGTGCEPTVKTATHLREWVYSIRDRDPALLLDGMRCSARDAEAALDAGEVDRAKTQLLVLASGALALFDRLDRKNQAIMGDKPRAKS